MHDRKVKGSDWFKPERMGGWRCSSRQVWGSSGIFVGGLIVGQVSLGKQPIWSAYMLVLHHVHRIQNAVCSASKNTFYSHFERSQMFENSNSHFNNHVNSDSSYLAWLQGIVYFNLYRPFSFRQNLAFYQVSAIIIENFDGDASLDLSDVIDGNDDANHSNSSMNENFTTDLARDGQLQALVVVLE